MRASGRSLILAFVVGVASLLPWGALVDKHVAIGSAFAAAYYFVAQLLLSRGRPRAYVTDWPTMLALDASALLLGLAFVGKSPQECIPLLYCTVGGTYAGAVAASLGAHARWPVLQGSAALPRLLLVSAGALVGGFVTTPFFGILGPMLERRVGCSPRWAEPGVSVACATLGWAMDSVGGGLGMGVGAYLADRRKGRLALVLACALAIVSAAQAAWWLTGRVLAESVRGNLMAVWVVAQVVAVALVERATALRRSADAPAPPVPEPAGVERQG